MEILVLLAIGVVTGVTTALFGFGGGFVTVPTVAWADTCLGGESVKVAAATSLVVMLVSALVATAAAPRPVLAQLTSRRPLLLLLAVGGAIGALLGRVAPAGVIRWGFVAYLALTVADLLCRPGFFTSVPARSRGGSQRRALPDVVGVPIGTIAAFLGVGGSVMTVPALRRSGAPMQAAAALANPLTVAIVIPATIVTLCLGHAPDPRMSGFVGAVDLRAALALLAGAVPTITLLRRRPVAIPHRLHTWGYLALLVIAGASVAIG